MPNYPKRFQFDYSFKYGTSATQTGSSVITATDAKLGAENPNYKRAIRSGISATTSFTGTKHELLLSVSDYDVTYTDTSTSIKRQTRYRHKGYVPAAGMRPSFASSVGDFSKCESIAAGRFYSNARSVMTSFNGLTFLGELAETIRMIKAPASGLRRGVEDLLEDYRKLRVNGRSLAKMNKAVAGMYLEHVFGWLPLISDTEDAVQAYNRALAKEVRSRCSGFGEESKQTLNEAGVMNPGTSALGGTYLRRGSTTSQVIYRGAVKCTAGGGYDMGGRMALFGFKADEFIPTVYELIPYSFLVDYFSNVGAIVSAETFAQAQLAWTARTTRVVSDLSFRHYYSEKVVAPAATEQVSGGGNTQWDTRRTVVARAPVPSVPVPDLRIFLPGSAAKWANIGALVASTRAFSKTLVTLLK